MAFIWGGSSATAWDGLVGSMTGSPIPHITIPPSELVVQSLLKRQASPQPAGTCGFLSSDFFSCGVNEYCHSQTGSDQNLISCCSYDSATTQGAGYCNITQTACVGSTQSVSLFGSSLCPDATVCCTYQEFPDCLTAILDNDDGLIYTMFYCATSWPATVTMTPMDKYVQTTTAIFTSISVSTSFLEPPNSSTTAVTTSASKSSSLTTAAGASTSNSTSSQDQQQSTESSAEKHKGAIIGGVVGSVAALLVVAAGFFIRHRINVKKREAGGGDNSPEMSGRVHDGMTYNSVAVR